MKEKVAALDKRLDRFYFKIYLNAGLAMIGIALTLWTIPTGGVVFTLDLPKLLTALGIFGVIRSN